MHDDIISKDNKNYTIGIILGNANSPHTAETIKGVKAAARELNVNIMCYTGVHSSYFFKEYFNSRQDEDFDYQASCVYDYIDLTAVDGLVISYGTLAVFLSEKEINRALKKFHDIPTVFIENRIEGPNAAYVIADNYNGIRYVMEHLISYHGYTKIAYLSGPVSNLDASERLKAYKNSMEQNNLPYSEKSIAYGDFSERVEKEVNQLLDDNEDVEAIVCANDKMAETVYKVLADRKVLYDEAVAAGNKADIRRYYKHEVGKNTDKHGVAVTGYDNVVSAENLDPPLTTVVQNAFSNGYTAVYNVLNIIRGEKKENVVAPPKLIKRSSCGCEQSAKMDFSVLNDYYVLHPDVYSAQIAKSFKDAVLLSDVNENVSDAVYDMIYQFVFKHVNRYLGFAEVSFSVDELVSDVRDMLSGEYEEFISLTSFASAMADYLARVLRNSTQKAGIELMVEASSKVIEYVHSKIYTNAVDMVAVYEHRTWFMPLISRDMANYLDSATEMYRNAMTKMQVLDMGNTYLFMLKEPVIHTKQDIWTCPENLYLVAYTANGEIKAYDIEDAPLVNKEIPFDKYLHELTVADENGNKKPYYASIINLYSGVYQYGALVAEIEPENILSFYYASVQISTALKYCEMARSQRSLQIQLEHMIEEVEQKNEILRSMSEYDQLTGCLNRRGFIERVNELMKLNSGSEAIMLFADLDHLKEINDKFGHGEGDFAIENIANILKNALPEDAIISRFGGDEFVVLTLANGSKAEKLLRDIKEMSLRYNALFAKPYYIETSVGYKDFICSENIDIEELMNSADESLYEAKKLRRKSIVKSTQVW